MPVTGPFYDFSGAPYYYNTDTQQRVSANVPAGTSLGSSPALGSVAQPAFIPQNVTLGGGNGGAGGSDLNALAAAFNSSGALTQQQINNQKAQFDANLEFQRQQMEQIGLPQLVIQQRLADLQQQQFQYQMYLTQQQQGLAESGLGLQALQAQAQLGGPSNWVQAYNLAQGLKQTDIPIFEQRLLTGQQTPAAVGGAGLSTPQSLQTLAGQAGAGGAGGVPGVTINGQPVAGGATSIGGSINPSLAPLPFLSQGGGGMGTASFAGAGGPLNRFGTTGAGPGSTTTSVAPGQSGPTTPENRSFGIGPASQDFGNGPGQGGVDVSGQRGLSTPTTTGFNIGDALRFNFAALTGKAPGSFIQLQDKNTGRVVGQSQVQGSNMPVTMTLLENMDPSHTYHIFTDYPSEGGATAGIDFSPSQLAVDNSAQGQAARQAVVDFWHSPAGNVDNRAYAGNDVFDRTLASQPAAAGAVRAAGAPSGSGYFVGTDGRIHVGSPSGTGQVGYGSSQGLMADPSWAPGTQVSDPNQLLKPAAPPASAPAAAAPAAAAPTAAPAPGSPDMNGVYGLGRAIFAAGGGALGPQALEGLGPTGTSMLQSVGQAVGGDWNTFANQYLRSRIGQGAAQAA